jgi:hypothetical protein
LIYSISRTRLYFKGLIRISGAPIAEFYDTAYVIGGRLMDAKGASIVRYSEGSLGTTIRNLEAEAVKYPNSDARDNLVQLNAAQRAFAQLKK